MGDIQTDRQTDSQTERQTDRDRQTDRQIDGMGLPWATVFKLLRHKRHGRKNLSSAHKDL